jgi:hypothetical protein
MLERFFFAEQMIDQFGIYDDVIGEPRVAKLKPGIPSSWETYVAQLKTSRDCHANHGRENH